MPRGLPGVLKAPGQWTEDEYRRVLEANVQTLPTKLSFRELNQGRIETGNLPRKVERFVMTPYEQWGDGLKVFMAQYKH